MQIIIMTSSQDDAILINFGSLLHFCRRLQAEESRKNYVEKYEKNRWKTIKDVEDIEEADKQQFPS